MPFSPDGNPLIGKVSLLSECYIITGLSSAGIMKGAGAGLLLAQMMLGDSRA